ncbi:PBP1b-binding outer membrane lipoprotein LpoB [Mesonia maritima]|uniref:PBP1b-binding outer membrane lipoprotein LpoB n=1 Tax=Mesonia maritima TaxID=1793873 RepID=A0ABU1KBB4_9FLAO|nr:PBP1b-binding outer membrane lipoprotein LpoB [Mesonia maritima]
MKSTSRYVYIVFSCLLFLSCSKEKAKKENETTLIEQEKNSSGTFI